MRLKSGRLWLVRSATHGRQTLAGMALAFSVLATDWRLTQINAPHSITSMVFPDHSVGIESDEVAIRVGIAGARNRTNPNS